MLKRTRVSSSMDTNRLGAAVSRPGIDPRIWKSLGIAMGDSMVDPDGQGVFVDVMLIPTQQQVTARVVSEYAGNGWGLYAPIYQNDELLIAIPSGHQSEGPVVEKRMWSSVDQPPDEAQREPQDILLVVQPGKNFRIVNSDDGQLMLGSENPTEDAILGTTFRQNQVQMDNGVSQQLIAAAADINSACTQLTLAGAQLSAGGPQIILLPSAGVAVAAAGAAITAAVVQLTAAATAINQAGLDIQQFETTAQSSQDYRSETVLIAD